MNFGLILILLYFATYGFGVLHGLAGIFEKHNIEKWKAYIPFVNAYWWIKIVGRPLWWFSFAFIPVAQLFVLVYLLSDIGKCYGKIRFKEQAKILLIPFLGLGEIVKDPNCLFQGDISIVGKFKKTQVREWADAIVFAMFAATLIRWATFEAFTIPTPSMENSLLVGDYLFVSKLHYGARTPKTPLQVPLTHQTIWFTDIFVQGGIKSYSTLLDLPTFRLPGFSHVKQGDVVVFNFPDEAHPVDLKTNYIKRCVAVAGDTIQLKNDVVFINSKHFKDPAEAQYKYFLECKSAISDKRFAKIGINIDYTFQQGSGYFVDATLKQVELLKKDFPEIVHIINTNEIIELNHPVYPNNPKHTKWNTHNFGPLWIPKKGTEITLTEENVILYSKQIEYYEGNKNVVITDDYKVKIDGKIIDKYTFKQDYYFMMGDNRGNSQDSRFWGFVPADHIVGKAALIWMSKDPHGGVRADRLFSFIK